MSNQGPEEPPTEGHADDDPLTEAWNQFRAKLMAVPDVTSLPREEVIRLCQNFFYVGAACAITPIMQGWYGAKTEDDLLILREATFIIGESVSNYRPDDTIGQLLTTMEAHAS